jgi:mRNA-degrading endonuclease RelE of RelBE toxin-antitoxin system
VFYERSHRGFGLLDCLEGFFLRTFNRAFDRPALARNRYRFRVGDYRIVYEIHDAVLLVLILAVGDRKEIYR